MKIKLFIILCCITFSMNCNAQSPGDNDPTFNVTDVGYGYGDGSAGQITTTSIQSDGKIIIGGDFNSYNGKTQNYISRLNTDGSIDTTFKSGVGAAGSVQASVIQSDGKIIIGGIFSFYNGAIRHNIARINNDGTNDTTFKDGTGANSYVQAIGIQNNGKIIIAGSFTAYNGINVNRIARLNANGSFDSTFNIGLGANGYIKSLVIQANGKIIIVGNFTSYNGTTINAIARINTNGSLDGTFNAGTGANNFVSSIGLQNDGKILIGGDFNSYNGSVSNGIARLDTNGTIDATFNSGNGTAGIKALVIQNDGKIIIGGVFTSYDGTACTRVTRINSNGTLDVSYNVGGTGASNYANSLAIQNDGKAIIVGNFFTYNNAVRNNIVRSNINGSIDTTFNVNSGANRAITAIAVQSDGKILLGGIFRSYNGIALNNLVRINSNGSIDTTFDIGTGTGYSSSSINAISIQNDGKIIIGGKFPFYNGDTLNCIVRLNTNGNIDTTFHIGSGFNNDIVSISIQTDGKIIIGGYFTSYNNTLQNFIVRLNPNGTLDMSFLSGSGVDNVIRTTALQSDGKIIIGGNFTNYNGTPSNYIARLNTDGTIDATFNSVLNDFVATISIQSDGKIIIGGSFFAFASVNPNRIARLNTNGSIDNTFNVGTGTDNIVYSTAIQSDGKIIISGTFSNFNGKNVNYIARLNPTGLLDSTFNIGTGANSYIWKTLIQNDGRVLVGGDFTAYKNIGRNRITRIETACTPPILTNATPNVNLTICAGQSATISVTNIGLINWFDSPISSLSLGTGSVLVTPTLSAGTYTFYAESNTCAVSINRTPIIVIVKTIPVVIITPISNVCIGSNANIVASGATSYIWSTGANTSSISITQSANTTYTVVGTNLCGTSSETINVNIDTTCADVWPGDANSDGIADNLDVLELGLHYTQTGASRAITSNLWQSYYSANWSGTITNGKNLNHSNCNGDGVINDDDTLAIYSNYSLTHVFKPDQIATNPQVAIVPDQSAVAKGTWGSASINLGDATAPISNINGIAYTISYDNTLLETDSVWIEYPMSFINASNQNLKFRKRYFGNGKLYTATTHTINGNVTGYGKIAILHYKIKSSLITDNVLNLSIAQANQSNASGVISPLTSGSATLMAIGASVGLNELTNGNYISLHPNPTNGALTINSPMELQKIDVMAITGQLLMSEVPSSTSHVLHLDHLANGVYFVNLYQNNRIVKREKIILNK